MIIVGVMELRLDAVQLAAMQTSTSFVPSNGAVLSRKTREYSVDFINHAEMARFVCLTLKHNRYGLHGTLIYLNS